MRQTIRLEIQQTNQINNLILAKLKICNYKIHTQIFDYNKIMKSYKHDYFNTLIIQNCNNFHSKKSDVPDRSTKKKNNQ